MRKSVIIGAAVLVVAAVGVVHLMDDPTPAPGKQTTKQTSKQTTDSPPPPAGTASVPAPSLPTDPRLAALQVSPDNGRIKFIVGANGKVIAEIDQDPASPAFGKLTREYLYFGDQIMRLTEYRYMSDHVAVTRTLVAYKPDGSVEDIKTVLETN